MGHHEAARSPAACLRTLLAAGGAGFITAGTVILKLLILHASLTLFRGGFFVALNFMISFIFIQIFNFKLATKQSSLFGAALGRRLRSFRAGFDHEIFRREMEWGLKTQAMSALGNLTFVIPVVYVFHLIFHSTFIDPATARIALQSLHPWKSASLPYAVFTGCLLWLCTFLGGAMANRFGRFSKTSATLFFNVFLGAALAFIPVLGKVLKIPLDVRHFTLSGGTVAVAATSLGFHKALDAGLISALFGVLWIGVLNFSVSFGLAFMHSLWRTFSNRDLRETILYEAP